MNNSNYLPQDLLSMILNIRGAEMKKEKEIKDNKNKYNQVINDFKNASFAFRYEEGKKEFHEIGYSWLLGETGMDDLDPPSHDYNMLNMYIKNPYLQDCPLPVLS